jgi:hypothetical protein
MADRGQLIIQLRVDGTIQAETKHIHGDACVSFATILEDLCAAEAIESEYTQDYYIANSTDEDVAKAEQHDHT